ncbi:MAG: hypothetical protein ACRDD1_06245, partial [Planctomycetia bacterium]
MTRTALHLLIFAAASTAAAAEPSPMVERFLHAGDFANGFLELEKRIAVEPTDDQARFGLGVLQVVRGVERLGRSLHQYGVVSENADAPIVRLPVPKNPTPSMIDYTLFRRILDDFRSDVAEAEKTLAGVRDDKVALPLRLSAIRLDFDGDGQASDRFADLLTNRRQWNPEFLTKNPEFLVRFDRGDVAWLRAYCNLTCAIVDFQLAFDLKTTFDLNSAQLFAKPKNPFAGPTTERWRASREAMNVVAVAEPLRLSRFRNHLLQVCSLNRETWRFIGEEKDDDAEWLPNPDQTGVLGLPVRQEMIDAWLGMIEQFEGML